MLGIVKFHKCRTEIISEVVEDIADPSMLDFWGKMELYCKTKSKVRGYTTYIGEAVKSDFNLLPTRSFVYVEIGEKTYGRLVRHQLQMNVSPRVNYGGIYEVNLYEEFNVDMEEWSNLPKEKWLQFGKRKHGDKMILQIKVSKVKPISENRDDILGELYLYSPVKIAVHILDEN